MDKVTRQCPQTTTFLKRKESQSGIEPRSFRLPAYALPLGQTGSQCRCWSLLYSAILCSRTNSPCSCCTRFCLRAETVTCDSKWVTGFLLRILEYPSKWFAYSTVWLLHGWCRMQLLQPWHILCTPYNVTSLHAKLQQKHFCKYLHAQYTHADTHTSHTINFMIRHPMRLVIKKQKRREAVCNMKCWKLGEQACNFHTHFLTPSQTRRVM